VSDSIGLIILCVWIASVTIWVKATQAQLEIMQRQIKKLEDRNASK